MSAFLGRKQTRTLSATLELHPTSLHRATPKSTPAQTLWKSVSHSLCLAHTPTCSPHHHTAGTTTTRAYIFTLTCPETCCCQQASASRHGQPKAALPGTGSLHTRYAVVKVRAVQSFRSAHPGSPPGGASLGYLLPRITSPTSRNRFSTDPGIPARKLVSVKTSGGLWRSMEDSGFEPLTYCVQSSRSPN